MTTSHGPHPVLLPGGKERMTKYFNDVADREPFRSTKVRASYRRRALWYERARTPEAQPYSTSPPQGPASSLHIMRCNQGPGPRPLLHPFILPSLFLDAACRTASSRAVTSLPGRRGPQGARAGAAPAQDRPVHAGEHALLNCFFANNNFGGMCPSMWFSENHGRSCGRRTRRQ
jgi:hypothetical protein